MTTKHTLQELLYIAIDADNGEAVSEDLRKQLVGNFYPCDVKMANGGDDSPFVLLSSFIAFRSTAIHCRERGDIANALAWERSAESCYRKLPNKYCW